MKANVLIVDDVQAECQLIADVLKAADIDSSWVLGGADAIGALCRQPFDAVITDLRMPGMDGIALCRVIAERWPSLPVIVATAFGEVESAVEAMKAGAYDFIAKPFDIDAVAIALRRASEHHTLRREVDALRRVVDTSKRYGALLGTSDVMRHLYDLIECAKDGDVPVLVTGESGTGKELVVREVHDRSSRSSGPLVVINCAALPETLLEGELFGYVKGAFAEAHTDRPGLFETARGGTLVLDEIGDMPLALQSRLLRALQERTVCPVGATCEVPFDARVVAVTNRDLDAAVENGQFREELFYRINVLPIPVPPLRARIGDILLLAQAFLGEVAVRTDRPVRSFTREAAERLQAYDWPGNVRELRNCIERAVALAKSEFVEVEDLPERVRDYHPRHVLVAGSDPNELIPLEDVERRYILRVLDACSGNRTHAARVLGIGRKTLYRRLARYGILGVEGQRNDDGSTSN
jgi:two-component system response regulator HydG